MIPGVVPGGPAIQAQNTSAGRDVNYNYVAVNYTLVVSAFEHIAASRPIDKTALAEAERRFEMLPLDIVPDIEPLPVGSRMPLDHNPLFVGRITDLRTLAKTLKVGQTTATGQTAIVTGLGGVGKTQLASEFVHRYGQFFEGGVFWLSFADPDAIAAGIAECGGAGMLNLYTNSSGLTQQEQVNLVLATWKNELPRLLVFDNCEHEALLQKWRPPRTSGCRVLVTSQRTEWDPSFGVTTLPLDVLPPGESIELLRKFRRDLSAADPDLANIADELGHLPLALHLAGNFLKRYQKDVTPAQYLAELGAASLLSHPSLVGEDVNLSPTNHDLHVGRTFAISYDRLKSNDATDQIALSLLARVAYLAPGEPISLSRLQKMLRPHGFQVMVQFLRPIVARRVDAIHREPSHGGAIVSEQNKPSMQEGRARRLITLAIVFVRIIGKNYLRTREIVLDVLQRSNEEQSIHRPHEFSRAARRLIADLGLLGTAQQGTVQVHRLVAQFIKRVAFDKHAQSDVEQVILAEAELINNGVSFGGSSELQRHLRYVTREALTEHADVRAADLCSQLGHPSLLFATLEEAAVHLERGLKIHRQHLGEYHYKTANSLFLFGWLHQLQINYPTARHYYEQALIIRRYLFGPDNFRLAPCLHGIGYCHLLAGDYFQAKYYLEQALTIRLQQLGATHPETARSYSSLGYLMLFLGEYRAAKDYLEQALAIREQAMSINYVSLGQTLNNLGELLYAQGHYVESYKCHIRALIVRQSLVNSVNSTINLSELANIAEHNDTAESLYNIGRALQALKGYEMAWRCLKRALDINNIVLGRQHRETALILHSLGVLVQEQGDLDLARHYFDSALTARVNVLGATHPDTAITLSYLGSLLTTQQQYIEARTYLERALGICEHHLGPDHPETARTLHYFGTLQKAQGHVQEALRYFKRALQIREVKLGTDHPDTQHSWREVANLSKDN